MGQLIAVVGNTGAGKTTLTRQLCRWLPLRSGLEQHAERPFQQLFAQEGPRYALANQVDYLLVRAEQEAEIRQSARVGIQDGGLDEDFHVFTHHFFQRGYLSEAEYQLCARLYRQLRFGLPPPEVMIYVRAPLVVLAERLAARRRPLEIAKAPDLASLQALLEAWLSSVDPATLITLDASGHDPDFAASLPPLLRRLSTQLGL